MPSAESSCSQFSLPRSRFPLLGATLLATGCTASPPPLDQVGRAALNDTVLSLFDSVAAIHTTHPDTGLLRRLHPLADTLLYIEGNITESFTGDSLFRRVRALHEPVRFMEQRFTDRQARIIDQNAAMLHASESVAWEDATGRHEFHGLMTLVVARVMGRWVIRGYRG